MRYVAQKSLDGIRITDTVGDNRIATCHHDANADLILRALNEREPARECYIVANGECITPFKCVHGGEIPLDEFVGAILRLYAPERLQQLNALLKKYMQRVVDCEGVDFIVVGQDYRKDDDPLKLTASENVALLAIANTLDRS